MNNKIVFATNNTNKIREIKQIIGGKFQILTLEDVGCFEDIPENQNTLVGNALQKARYIYDKYKINSFADDTGLEVDCLNGMPGVYSARYAGEEQNSEKNIQKLLNELGDTSERTAKFRTIIALVLEDKDYFFEGVIEGTIAGEPKGENGFGYDPVFIPRGFDETFAEMPPEIKNKISHRLLVLEKLTGFLKNYNLSNSD